MMKKQTLCTFLVLGLGSGGMAAEPLVPVDQLDLNKMIAAGQAESAFLEAFEAGDELTEFSFDAAQGVGANIGEGRRFTRFPRADLDGPTDWANHTPAREGGANATSCIACHNAPFDNGAGDVALNVVVDPGHTGDPSKYLERNTLPLFALGIPQRLAEEISQKLYAQRANGIKEACQTGRSVTQLSAKGVSYGHLNIRRVGINPCKVNVDASGLDGIDESLVIKPFGWKGNHATIRAFTRGAAHNELGLQAVELVGDADGDFDGVTNELTVGDMTALTIYMAALERPVSKIELADLGLMELAEDTRAEIQAGESLFTDIGCSSCHVPEMTLDDTRFREPSRVPGYFDEFFPDGSDPSSHGLTSASAITFDLAADQPNNQITLDEGGMYLLGALEMSDSGSSIARWFTDFKRHDMGPALSDPDDPLGLGASMFLTRSLAGVGVTGPWLHDGRATTLADAITMHGGDAEDSAKAFRALQSQQKAELIAFLDSLVMYKAE